MEKELVELDITSLAFEGQAIARKDDIVYFVKNALPGDKVIARILKKNKRYFESKMVEVLEPSEHRIKPLCSHFGVCGGCTLQNLRYEEQLKWKKQHIADAFERIAKSIPVEIRETLPAPKTFGYRNKMEFSFGTSRWLSVDEIVNNEDIQHKDFALGLHIPGRYDKVVDVEKCYIIDDVASSALSPLREKALELNLKSFNLKTHEGFLRQFVVRLSEYTNEAMFILITTSPKSGEEKKFIEWYKTEFPEYIPETSNLIHAVNDTFSPVATGEPDIIQGKDYLIERIHDVDFRISPFSFFQTNSSQLDRFINSILELAGIGLDDIVWDLYCGTGSITLPAARQAKKIFGLELSESSIRDAKSNAQLNQISNVEFYAVDLHSKNIAAFLWELPQPDVLIVDPPRAGMHSNLIEHIMEISPAKLVYVSCNPATQARDCGILSEKYEINLIQPVDMFPQTYHIESVAQLVIR